MPVRIINPVPHDGNLLHPGGNEGGVQGAVRAAAGVMRACNRHNPSSASAKPDRTRRTAPTVLGIQISSRRIPKKALSCHALSSFQIY